MRCEQCGYSNQADHKFCGMCGARLETAAGAVSGDDEDLLGLESVSVPRGRKQETAQVTRRDQLREVRRDMRSVNSRPVLRTDRSTFSVKDFPADTAQEESVEEIQERKRADRASGISGPSFLGLGQEASNSGFVYDDSRDDGFVYDSPSETPEYLLTEVSRGVSWRAWALFLLLLVAAGLGYIQWRASRNEGPDIAAILSGNGAAVGPGGPTMSGNTKPAAPKPNTPSADSSKAENAQPADGSDSGSGNSDGTSTKTATDGTNSSAGAKETSDSKATSAKRADNQSDSENSNANTSSEKPGTGASPKKASAKEDEEGAAAKSASDGTDTSVAKANRGKRAPVDEEATQPRSLGEKDPLIIKAEKYIQGHGARKNCSTGINLLRQAVSEGNPAADVKMGALYWSGTCVTQSKVAAYEWFSRAHSLEPRNRWIERSRNSLWASMSPFEKQRTSY